MSSIITAIPYLLRISLEFPSKEVMVGVAQLVEHSVVVRDVAGSSPVVHPTI